MIVSENTPKTPLKANKQVSSTSAGPSQPAPPAYDYQSVPHRDSEQLHQAFYQHVAPPQAPPAESAGRRFFKALAVAVLIWLLISLFFGTIATSGGHSGRYSDHLDYPVPVNVKLEDCNDWSSQPDGSSGYPFRYHAHTSFDLPIDSTTLFLLSRGALNSGSVEISTSSDLTDLARVDVTVGYYRQDLLDSIKVCRAERDSGETGVGLFTPRQWVGRRGPEDQVEFRTKIIFPLKSSSLLINNLETDVPNFVQKLEPLRGLIHFRSLSLKSSNGAIIGQSLDVLKTSSLSSTNALVSLDLISPEIAVKTTNGAIRGIYNSSSSLILSTTNAPISATANLESADSSTRLVMKTTNSPIDGIINLLHSNKSKKTQSSFDITTTTTNDPLKVVVATSLVDSVIKYNGRTTNARAELVLPATFEGRLGLFTTNSAVSLEVDEKATDPAGRGRQRHVQTQNTRRGTVEGFVFWDEQNKEQSSAKILSTNGWVSVKL